METPRLVGARSRWRGRLRTGAAKTFRAGFADGRRVAGMVFPGELLWDDAPPLAAAVLSPRCR